MNKDLEKEILIFIKKIKIFFDKNNSDYVFSFDLNKNGVNSKLFSEIEIEIWKDTNLEYVYSIILFINGKEQGSKEELVGEFLYDLYENFMLTSVKDVN